MGKGSRPRPKADRPNIKAREKPKAGKTNGGGDGKSTVSVDQCWTFALVEPSSAAKSAKVGTAVRGAKSGTRIAVIARGVLGYAPPRESREMINALTRTGESLVGEIVLEMKNSQP